MTQVGQKGRRILSIPGGKMKEDTQERIWKAVDGAFGESADGRSRERVFEKTSEFLQFLQLVLSVASTPEKLKTVRDTIEEPSEEELTMIERVIAFAPKLLPRMIGEKIYAKAVVLIKETPGRKRAIPEELYSEICDQVSALCRVKVSEPDAKARIASRHGVSSKTIDRIWSKRDEYFGEANMTSAQAREILEPILHEAFSPAGWKESREAIILASEPSKIERN